MAYFNDETPGSGAEKILREIDELDRKKRGIENQLKEKKQKLLKEMKKAGVDKFSVEGVATVNYIYPTVQRRFDTSLFKARNPAMYKLYIMESDVKESIRISFEKIDKIVREGK